MSIRLAAHVGNKIANLPQGSVILLRRGRITPAGIFERVVADLAAAAQITVQWREPKIGDRSTVYLRDYTMVDDSDYVEAYFPLGSIMEGGTGHIVDAALNREKRVYAWSVDAEGRVDRIGEIEPTPIDRYHEAW
jgi:hypothetical protein